MEGSSHTGSGKSTDSCNVVIPSGSEPPNTDRRYVIDEAMGSVNVLWVFQTMANAPDSHELRLEGGRLRYVHTMTGWGVRKQLVRGFESGNEEMAEGDKAERGVCKYWNLIEKIKFEFLR
jgi:hypothetical protein